MKRWLGILMAGVLLTGCGSAPVMETVADEVVILDAPEPRAISVVLPGETAMPTMESDAGRIYMSRDYEICIQTLPGGDISATVETMSGFSEDALTVVATQQAQTQRYDFVWAAAGEGGDLLGRGVILDDGVYHYTLSVLRDPESDTSSFVCSIFNCVFT